MKYIENKDDLIKGQIYLIKVDGNPDELNPDWIYVYGIYKGFDSIDSFPWLEFIDSDGTLLLIQESLDYVYELITPIEKKKGLLNFVK